MDIIAYNGHNSKHYKGNYVTIPTLEKDGIQTEGETVLEEQEEQRVWK